MVTKMNTQQRKVLAAWPKLLQDFARREWSSLLVWSGIGGVVAGFARLVLLDRSFQAFVASKYPHSSMDQPGLYSPYAVLVALVIVLAVVFRAPFFVWRGLRSWWFGVTSGLALLPFAIAFTLLTLRSPSGWSRLLAGLGVVAASFALSFVLHLWARMRAVEVPSEEDLRVQATTRSLAGAGLPESDDPITTWSEDALGRAALVDSMSVKLMISRSPVLALFGELGAGKTSMLNLLREHLTGKAIVVSFSTWLPGSQETLTAYLLNDIARECLKHYVVPGLRKSAQRAAKALGRSVPILKSYLELLPPGTQRDDIDSMKEALGRLPKRVIVLLDEVDRMEKEELLTLLKVIRGISTLPNLSFVVAGDRKSIVEIVKEKDSDENRVYFEKFFPVSIQIPKPDPTALRKAGTERLVSALDRREWFDSELERENFRKQIDSIWDERIAPFCRNVRAVGLLANDVGTAAAPLRREVDPVDLTLIELLRRFTPIVYEIVGRSSPALTGGEDLLRGGSYYTDEAMERLKQKLLEDLRQAVDGDRFEQVTGILRELFPLFPKTDTRFWVPRPAWRVDEKSPKRVCKPGIFPAYFRYELPEAMFSSVEMNAFLKRMEDAGTEGERELVFLQTLGSMEKKSLKRDDFLRRIEEAARSISLPAGKAIVHAAMKAADSFSYDVLPGFGEAGHALRIVLRISERIAHDDRVALLSECITEATDDTIASRVLQDLTGSHENFDLGISMAQLYPSFVERMRQHYGRDVDAVNFDFSKSDPWAFDLWGRDPVAEGVSADPEDRAIQREFWLRYIGRRRSRLANAFRRFFLPDVLYQGDPVPIVENKIPVTDLERLYEELPEEPDLTDLDQRALKILGKFLDGHFKGGIGHTARLYSDKDGAADDVA
jgi:hypothetical protein